MKKEVISAKTLEEAKTKACETLNASLEELVISEKEVKTGLFNKRVEIVAITKSDLNKYIKDYLLELIKNIGINVNIETKVSDDIPTFNIITDQNSILIGRNGRTIEALQNITSQMIYLELNTYYKFIIDVSDYKRKRVIRLEKLAKYTAKDVARSKMPVNLEPMNSYERRIIHNALNNSKDVITESEGEEPNRYVVIKPKED